MSWLLILAILGGIFAPAPAIGGVSSETTIRGNATWYDYVPGGAAAGPRLRDALGSTWRGTRVSVCHAGRCVRVKLSDWCLCSHGNRVIDLDSRSFARLADPGRGVIEVQVSADDEPTPTLPPTDTSEKP